MTPHVAARRRHLVIAALSTLLLAGCGTAVVGGTAFPEGGAATAGGASAAAGGGGGTPIDVCSFFTDAEVKQLIGSSPKGRPQTGNGDGGGCGWEDPDTNYSLTVDIGETDTAINGTLPKWDPAFGPERTLPGGMRDVNGSVEFVCGGTRYCSVQVVRVITGNKDQQTGIGLVPKIRAKVGG